MRPQPLLVLRNGKGNAVFLLPVIFHKCVTMKDNCNKQAAIGLVQIARMSDTDTITLTKGEVINLFKAYTTASLEVGRKLAELEVNKFLQRTKEGRL